MKKTLLLLLFVLTVVSCQAPQANDLHGAARMGSVKRVQKALELGVKVNQLQGGRTPLHTAVASGKGDVVPLLVENGADLSATDDEGNTPWLLLWEHNRGFLNKGEVDCAIALLEAGVKPESLEGTSYLHKVAKMADNSRLVALLLESGMELEGRDKHGWTALHVAANRGREENVTALLSAGADANAETTETWVESYQRGESTLERFRYEAGSRPMDVAAFGGGGRGSKSVRAILKEWKATENPEVDNRIESR